MKVSEVPNLNLKSNKILIGRHWVLKFAINFATRTLELKLNTSIKNWINLKLNDRAQGQIYWLSCHPTHSCAKCGLKIIGVGLNQNLKNTASAFSDQNFPNFLGYNARAESDLAPGLFFVCSLRNTFQRWGVSFRRWKALLRQPYVILKYKKLLKIETFTYFTAW